MQIRCQQCHKPFALSKADVLAALDAIQAEDLHHYDVACPHCRRMNKVSPVDLRRAAPEWGKTPEEEKE